MEIIFLVHLFVTFFMTGLCWFVQIVHYPLFKFIGKSEFTRYEQENMVTGWITIPLMGIETLTALVLLIFDYHVVYAINFGFILLIAFSTFIFQVPLHLQLSRKVSLLKINKLIATNWIRTISWSCRASILLVYLYAQLS